MNRIWILFVLGYSYVTANYQLNDYSDHPCIRPCGINTRKTCEYTFTLEYYYTLSKACYDCPFNASDCNRPHCVPADGSPRPILTANRMLPGPGIHVCLNDTIVVNIVNNLLGGEGVSIHWHGIHVQPHMDGVAMLTQCPIPEYSSFQYRFLAVTPGTHYWHSHAGMQNADGLFGPLVIREPPEIDEHLGRYDVDHPEFTIMINDWFKDMMPGRLSSLLHRTGSVLSDSMLINGKGAYHKFIRDTTTVYTPYEVFNVQLGRRYRFRVITNSLNTCPILFSIDNHNLTVIASDGSPLEPYTVDSVVMYSGERYDIIVHTNQDVRNYWMRTSGMLLCGTLKAFQLAVVKYEGAAEEEPLGNKEWNVDTHGIQLDPLNKKTTEGFVDISQLNSTMPNDESLKEVPDKTIYLGYDFNIIDNFRAHDKKLYSVHEVDAPFRRFTQQINHISTVFPPAPAQTQYSDIPSDLFCNEDSLKANCTSEFCQCFHVIEIGLGEVVEIFLVDEGATFNTNHPFHLHGNYFRVIGLDKLNTSTSIEEVKALDAKGMIHRKLDRAPLKDSVMTHDGGFTILRLHAKNPGFWFFHCHFQTHTEMGMGLTLQVGTPSQQPKVPKKFPKCGPWIYEGYEEEGQESKDCPTNKECRVMMSYECYVVQFLMFYTIMLLY